MNGRSPAIGLLSYKNEIEKELSYKGSASVFARSLRDCFDVVEQTTGCYKNRSP